MTGDGMSLRLGADAFIMRASVIRNFDTSPICSKEGTIAPHPISQKREGLLRESNSGWMQFLLLPASM